MTSTKFNSAIDAIQGGLVWFVIGIITICIAVLFMFDVLAGTGTMLYLTGGQEWQSVVISLATTGLLFALMFIGYMLTENKNKMIKSVGMFIIVAAGLVYLLDIVFDALLADVLRYGTVMLGQRVELLQWMFRGLLGGISTVGDALALAMVMGMPVLKNIIQMSINPGGNYGNQNNIQTGGSARYVSKQHQGKFNIPTSIPRAAPFRASTPVVEEEEDD